MVTPVAIDDPDDPRLADYRAVRERDLVGRQGRFIAEGEQVVRVLFARGRFPVRSLLVNPTRADELAPLAPPDVPVYIASTHVMSALTGFHIHRGVLAAAERGPLLAADELVARARTLVVLEGITNHDNVGGIFRNAAAFGVDAVLYDDTTCDPLYRKAIRVSVGGALIVPFARFSSSAALLATLRSAGFASVALTPRADAQPIEKLRPPQKVALWLGTEGTGLDAATITACDYAAMIPMAPGFDSLNVATTSGIALYALRAASSATISDA